MIDEMNGKVTWRHLIVAILLILGVSVIFSLHTGQPVDKQDVAVDVTSVLILGG